MMDRSGYAGKPGQERLLAIHISREGFELALDHAGISSFHRASYEEFADWKRAVANSPVRVQWDPERTLNLEGFMAA